MFVNQIHFISNFKPDDSFRAVNSSIQLQSNNNNKKQTSFELQHADRTVLIFLACILSRHVDLIFLRLTQVNRGNTYAVAISHEGQVYSSSHECIYTHARVFNVGQCVNLRVWRASFFFFIHPSLAVIGIFFLSFFLSKTGTAQTLFAVWCQADCRHLGASVSSLGWCV